MARYPDCPPPHAQIDWSHPITKGLVSALHGNSVYAGVNGGTGVAKINGRLRSGAVKGQRVSDYYEGDGTNGDLTLNTIKTGTEASVFTVMQWDGTGGGGYARVYEDTQCRFMTASTGQIDIERATTAAYATGTVNTGIASANTVWHSIGINYPDSLTPTDMQAYINGTQRTVNSAGTGTGSTNGNNSVLTPTFFGRGDGARVVDGRAKCFYRWVRQLTPAEHQLLSRDPFCFWTDGYRPRISNPWKYGDGSAILAVTSAAQGLRQALGAGASGVSVVTTADGLREALATGDASLSITASSAGLGTLQGSADASIALTGIADALRTALGAGGAELALTAASAGIVGILGAGSALLAISAAGSGDIGTVAWLQSLDTSQAIQLLLLTQASSKSLRYSVTDLDAGDQIAKSYWMLKRSWTDSDAEALIVKPITTTWSSSGRIVEAGSGENATLEFSIRATDSEGVEPGEYVCGVKSVLSDGLAYVHDRTVTRVHVLDAMVEATN